MSSDNDPIICSALFSITLQEILFGANYFVSRGEDPLFSLLQISQNERYNSSIDISISLLSVEKSLLFVPSHYCFTIMHLRNYFQEKNNQVSNIFRTCQQFPRSGRQKQYEQLLDEFIYPRL